MAPPGLEEQLAWEDSLSEDTCCSYEEWRDAGYQVQRGQRAVFWDALGVPQFTIEQVVDLRGNSG
jgi:hypothetical protein